MPFLPVKVPGAVVSAAIAGKGLAGIEHCVVVNTNCGGAGNDTAQCNFMHSGYWFAIYLLHVFVSFNYVKLVYR
jgi:hypothetical protein